MELILSPAYKVLVAQTEVEDQLEVQPQGRVLPTSTGTPKSRLYSGFSARLQQHRRGLKKSDSPLLLLEFWFSGFGARAWCL